MDIGNLIIILYLLAWGLVFVYTWKKSRQFGIGLFIISEFIACGFISYNMYNDSYSDFYKISIAFFPFVVFFFFAYLTSYPLIRYDRTRIDSIQAPSDRLTNIIAIIFIVTSLANFPQAISDVVTNLPKIIIQNAGSELYDNASFDYEKAGHGISNLPSVISGMFSDVATVITFYYIALNDPKKKKILILLLICIVPNLFSGIARGQRGDMVQYLLFYTGSYFLFRRFFNEQIKKKIDRIGVIIIAIIITPIIYISISRFSTYQQGWLSGTSGYMGQSTLLFNQYAFDNNGIRYGDRVAPFFKLVMGFDNIPNNFIERRAKYPSLKINDECFISYIGDFFLDFGPFWASLILLIFATYINRITRIRNRVILFHQLIIYEVLIAIITPGIFKLFPYSEIPGNVKLLFDFFLCAVFYHDYMLHKKKKILSNKT